MNGPSTSHTSFTIDRAFGAPPERVFEAWTDPAAKRLWADCHAEDTTNYSLDFRVLGRETHRVRHPDGSVQLVEKVFFDIVAGRRIVFAYDIGVDGRRLSVSLVTVEFAPSGAGTRMVYTEQLAYLDGHHDLAQRMQGTAEGLDRLALFLQEPGLPQ
ncbi:SRPBCC family protein [Ramlibacter pallidus]|uniref:SRPBCC family protein n=1 Tax=Ramlibacter pallidus TaxID=2780087 RepID=A0ABR9RYX6_9BURK|nr:SRPBCC family protein [Ramlibacter pallidus]MBE7366079.1 SRPBCC family protein [Ramlibacter pallidus]